MTLWAGGHSREPSARSRLRPRDLGREAIVGLSQTAAGQIGRDFNLQDATQVTVHDTAAANASVPTLDFPADADARADRIDGVVAAGVWWTVAFSKAAVSALPA